MEVKEGVEEETCYGGSTFYSVEVRYYEDLQTEFERGEMSVSHWAMSADTLRRESNRSHTHWLLSHESPSHLRRYLYKRTDSHISAFGALLHVHTMEQDTHRN